VLPDQVRLDLQWMARDFEVLLATAPTGRLDEPTDGTRWTNRQLLWHMAFGQHIARVLLPLMGGFSQLPASASRRYASTLSAATRPYDWVNFAGSVAGARVTGLRLARRWMRRDTERLLGWGARATDAQLASGMSVPADWDPYFTPRMSRYDVMVWTKKHYDHHRAQLTLDGAESPLSGPHG
jgi:hypothetical protein